MTDADPATVLYRVLHRDGHSPLLVGLSGGLDSTVLLHALSEDPQIRAQGLRAVHVHHGLQPLAEDWANHCTGFCGSINVPLTILVSVVPCQFDLTAYSALPILNEDWEILK